MPNENIADVIARLQAKDDIRDLVYRFSYLADMNDPDGLQELITDDCVLDMGPGRRNEGRAAILAYQRMRLSGTDAPAATQVFRSSAHHNSNVLIDFESPTRARLLTSLYAWHQVEDVFPQVWGWYHDVVVADDGRWRFAERVLRLAGHDPFPGSYDWHFVDRRPGRIDVAEAT